MLKQNLKILAVILVIFVVTAGFYFLSMTTQAALIP